MSQPSEEAGEISEILPRREGARRFLFDKEAGQAEAWGPWGKVIGNKKKVR